MARLLNGDTNLRGKLLGRLAGDSQDRLLISSDGIITLGRGSSAARTGGMFNLDMGSVSGMDGLRIYATSDTVSPGQVFQVFDSLNQPIFAIPVAGGPAVLGDNFRVHDGGDIFNAEVQLYHTGGIKMRKGDPAGGVGVFSIGNATTIPNANPDGSTSGTVAGAVLWSISGRLFYRSQDGEQYFVGNVERIDVGLPGPLAVTTGTFTYPIPEASRIESIQCSLGTSGTSTTTVDVNYASTYGGALSTVYTTQANRPSMASGSRGVLATLPDVRNVAQGGVMSVDIDAAGTGARDLLTSIRLRRTS